MEAHCQYSHFQLVSPIRLSTVFGKKQTENSAVARAIRVLGCHVFSDLVLLTEPNSFPSLQDNCYVNKQVEYDAAVHHTLHEFVQSSLLMAFQFSFEMDRGNKT